MLHICLRKLNISFVCNKELCKYLFCAQFDLSPYHGTVESREFICATLLIELQHHLLLYFIGWSTSYCSFFNYKQKTEELNLEFRCYETDFFLLKNCFFKVKQNMYFKLELTTKIYSNRFDIEKFIFGRPNTKVQKHSRFTLHSP